MATEPPKKKKPWKTHYMPCMRSKPHGSTAKLRDSVIFGCSSRLEEMRIKLSSVVTDLLGASGLRILRALAAGETEAKRLAALGDNRLKCTEEQLLDALT